MPNYTVEYETWNTYENHGGESYFCFLILPGNTQWQKRTSYTCSNSISEPIYISRNHYGFEQVVFRSLKPFDSLILHMKCDVHVSKSNPFDFSPMTKEEETKILQSTGFFIDHGHYLMQSQYTSLTDSTVPGEWNKRLDENAFDYLLRLMSVLHSSFGYESDITDVHHTAGDTIKLGRGVCQDFSHVFIAVARNNGIPCRYVSGYLDQGADFKGSLQMHAWVEALVPGIGWTGFDPTNNILQDFHYIKVCHGVDYSECSPIRGILKSHGAQSTEYAVKVVQQ